MSAVPVQKPIIVSRPRPQLRVEQGTRPSVASKVIAKSALFGALTLSFFFSSSLAGQVMVEKARRDGQHAIERAKDASKEESLLRDKVQSLTRASAIAAWADQNGFIASEAQLNGQVSSDSGASVAGPSSRVASRKTLTPVRGLTGPLPIGTNIRQGRGTGSTAYAEEDSQNAEAVQ